MVDEPRLPTLRLTFALEVGSDTGSSWFLMRWYTIDWAGHLACHVQFATRNETRRPEGVNRLSLEFLTEPAMVEQFAHELISLSRSYTGEAAIVWDLRSQPMT